MNRKEIRYRNAQDHFIRTIREGGDGTAYREALEEYKGASDEYYSNKFTREDNKNGYIKRNSTSI